MGWEAEILLFIQEHIRSDFFNPVMTVFTHTGDYGIFVMALAAVLLILDVDAAHDDDADQDHEDDADHDPCHIVVHLFRLPLRPRAGRAPAAEEPAGCESQNIHEAVPVQLHGTYAEGDGIDVRVLHLRSP